MSGPSSHRQPASQQHLPPLFGLSRCPLLLPQIHPDSCGNGSYHISSAYDSTTKLPLYSIDPSKLGILERCVLLQSFFKFFENLSFFRDSATPSLSHIFGNAVPESFEVMLRRIATSPYTLERMQHNNVSTKKSSEDSVQNLDDSLETTLNNTLFSNLNTSKKIISPDMSELNVRNIVEKFIMKIHRKRPELILLRPNLVEDLIKLPLDTILGLDDALLRGFDTHDMSDEQSQKIFKNATVTSTMSPKEMIATLFPSNFLNFLPDANNTTNLPQTSLLTSFVYDTPLDQPVSIKVFPHYSDKNLVFFNHPVKTSIISTLYRHITLLIDPLVFQYYQMLLQQSHYITTCERALIVQQEHRIAQEKLQKEVKKQRKIAKNKKKIQKKLKNHRNTHHSGLSNVNEDQETISDTDDDHYNEDFDSSDPTSDCSETDHDEDDDEHDDNNSEDEVPLCTLSEYRNSSDNNTQNTSNPPLFSNPILKNSLFPGAIISPSFQQQNMSAKTFCENNNNYNQMSPKTFIPPSSPAVPESITKPVRPPSATQARHHNKTTHNLSPTIPITPILTPLLTPSQCQPIDDLDVLLDALENPSEHPHLPPPHQEHLKDTFDNLEKSTDITTFIHFNTNNYSLDIGFQHIVQQISYALEAPTIIPLNLPLSELDTSYFDLLNTKNDYYQYISDISERNYSKILESKENNTNIKIPASDKSLKVRPNTLSNVKQLTKDQKDRITLLKAQILVNSGNLDPTLTTQQVIHGYLEMHNPPSSSHHTDTLATINDDVYSTTSTSTTISSSTTPSSSTLSNFVNTAQSRIPLIQPYSYGTGIHFLPPQPLGNPENHSNLAQNSPHQNPSQPTQPHTLQFSNISNYPFSPILSQYTSHIPLKHQYTLRKPPSNNYNTSHYSDTHSLRSLNTVHSLPRQDVYRRGPGSTISQFTLQPHFLYKNAGIIGNFPIFKPPLMKNGVVNMRFNDKFAQSGHNLSSNNGSLHESMTKNGQNTINLENMTKDHKNSIIPPEIKESGDAIISPPRTEISHPIGFNPTLMSSSVSSTVHLSSVRFLAEKIVAIENAYTQTLKTTQVLRLHALSLDFLFKLRFLSTFLALFTMSDLFQYALFIERFELGNDHFDPLDTHSVCNSTENSVHTSILSHALSPSSLASSGHQQYTNWSALSLTPPFIPVLLQGDYREKLTHLKQLCPSIILPDLSTNAQIHPNIILPHKNGQNFLKNASTTSSSTTMYELATLRLINPERHILSPFEVYTLCKSIIALHKKLMSDLATSTILLTQLMVSCIFSMICQVHLKYGAFFKDNIDDNDQRRRVYEHVTEISPFMGENDTSSLKQFDMGKNTPFSTFFEGVNSEKSDNLSLNDEKTDILTENAENNVIKGITVKNIDGKYNKKQESTAEDIEQTRLNHSNNSGSDSDSSDIVNVLGEFSPAELAMIEQSEKITKNMVNSQLNNIIHSGIDGNIGDLHLAADHAFKITQKAQKNEIGGKTNQKNKISCKNGVISHSYTILPHNIDTQPITITPIALLYTINQARKRQMTQQHGGIPQFSHFVDFEGNNSSSKWTSSTENAEIIKNDSFLTQNQLSFGNYEWIVPKIFSKRWILRELLSLKGKTIGERSEKIRKNLKDDQKSRRRKRIITNDVLNRGIKGLHNIITHKIDNIGQKSHKGEGDGDEMVIIEPIYSNFDPFSSYSIKNHQNIPFLAKNTDFPSENIAIINIPYQSYTQLFQSHFGERMEILDFHAEKYNELAPIKQNKSSKVRENYELNMNLLEQYDQHLLSQQYGPLASSSSSSEPSDVDASSSSISSELDENDVSSKDATNNKNYIHFENLMNNNEILSNHLKHYSSKILSHVTDKISKRSEKLHNIVKNKKYLYINGFIDGKNAINIRNVLKNQEKIFNSENSENSKKRLKIKGKHKIIPNFCENASFFTHHSQNSRNLSKSAQLTQKVIKMHKKVIKQDKYFADKQALLHLFDHSAISNIDKNQRTIFDIMTQKGDELGDFDPKIAQIQRRYDEKSTTSHSFQIVTQDSKNTFHTVHGLSFHDLDQQSAFLREFKFKNPAFYNKIRKNSEKSSKIDKKSLKFQKSEINSILCGKWTKTHRDVLSLLKKHGKLVYKRYNHSSSSIHDDNDDESSDNNNPTNFPCLPRRQSPLHPDKVHISPLQQLHHISSNHYSPQLQQKDQIQESPKVQLTPTIPPEPSPDDLTDIDDQHEFHMIMQSPVMLSIHRLASQRPSSSSLSIPYDDSPMTSNFTTSDGNADLVDECGEYIHSSTHNFDQRLRKTPTDVDFSNTPSSFGIHVQKTPNTSHLNATLPNSNTPLAYDNPLMENIGSASDLHRKIGTNVNISHFFNDIIAYQMDGNGNTSVLTNNLNTPTNPNLSNTASPLQKAHTLGGQQGKRGEKISSDGVKNVPRLNSVIINNSLSLPPHHEVIDLTTIPQPNPFSTSSSNSSSLSSASTTNSSVNLSDRPNHLNTLTFPSLPPESSFFYTSPSPSSSVKNLNTSSQHDSSSRDQATSFTTSTSTTISLGSLLSHPNQPNIHTKNALPLFNDGDYMPLLFSNDSTTGNFESIDGSSRPSLQPLPSTIRYSSMVSTMPKNGKEDEIDPNSPNNFRNSPNQIKAPTNFMKMSSSPKNGESQPMPPQRVHTIAQTFSSRSPTMNADKSPVIGPNTAQNLQPLTNVANIHPLLINSQSLSYYPTNKLKTPRGYKPSLVQLHLAATVSKFGTDGTPLSDDYMTQMVPNSQISAQIAQNNANIAQNGANLLNNCENNESDLRDNIRPIDDQKPLISHFSSLTSMLPLEGDDNSQSISLARQITTESTISVLPPLPTHSTNYLGDIDGSIKDDPSEQTSASDDGGSSTPYDDDAGDRTSLLYLKGYDNIDLGDVRMSQMSLQLLRTDQSEGERDTIDPHALMKPQLFDQMPIPGDEAYTDGRMNVHPLIFSYGFSLGHGGDFPPPFIPNEQNMQNSLENQHKFPAMLMDMHKSVDAVYDGNDVVVKSLYQSLHETGKLRGDMAFPTNNSPKIKEGEIHQENAETIQISDEHTDDIRRIPLSGAYIEESFASFHTNNYDHNIDQNGPYPTVPLWNDEIPVPSYLRMGSSVMETRENSLDQQFPPNHNSKYPSSPLTKPVSFRQPRTLKPSFQEELRNTAVGGDLRTSVLEIKSEQQLAQAALSLQSPQSITVNNYVSPLINQDPSSNHQTSNILQSIRNQRLNASIHSPTIFEDKLNDINNKGSNIAENKHYLPQNNNNNILEPVNNNHNFHSNVPNIILKRPPSPSFARQMSISSTNDDIYNTENSSLYLTPPLILQHTQVAPPVTPTTSGSLTLGLFNPLNDLDNEFFDDTVDLQANENLVISQSKSSQTPILKSNEPSIDAFVSSDHDETNRESYHNGEKLSDDSDYYEDDQNTVDHQLNKNKTLQIQLDNDSSSPDSLLLHRASPSGLSTLRALRKDTNLWHSIGSQKDLDTRESDDSFSNLAENSDDDDNEDILLLNSLLFQYHSGVAAAVPHQSRNNLYSPLQAFRAKKKLQQLLTMQSPPPIEKSNTSSCPVKSPKNHFGRGGNTLENRNNTELGVPLNFEIDANNTPIISDSTMIQTSNTVQNPVDAHIQIVRQISHALSTLSTSDSLNHDGSVDDGMNGLTKHRSVLSLGSNSGTSSTDTHTNTKYCPYEYHMRLKRKYTFDNDGVSMELNEIPAKDFLIIDSGGSEEIVVNTSINCMKTRSNVKDLQCSFEKRIKPHKMAINVLKNMIKFGHKNDKDEFLLKTFDSRENREYSVRLSESDLYDCIYSHQTLINSIQKEKNQFLWANNIRDKMTTFTMMLLTFTVDNYFKKKFTPVRPNNPISDELQFQQRTVQLGDFMSLSRDNFLKKRVTSPFIPEKFNYDPSPLKNYLDSDNILAINTNHGADSLLQKYHQQYILSTNHKIMQALIGSITQDVHIDDKLAGNGDKSSNDLSTTKKSFSQQLTTTTVLEEFNHIQGYTTRIPRPSHPAAITVVNYDMHMTMNQLCAHYLPLSFLSSFDTTDQNTLYSANTLSKLLTRGDLRKSQHTTAAANPLTLTSLYSIYGNPVLHNNIKADKEIGGNMPGNLCRNNNSNNNENMLDLDSFSSFTPFEPGFGRVFNDSTSTSGSISDSTSEVNSVTTNSSSTTGLTHTSSYSTATTTSSSTTFSLGMPVIKRVPMMAAVGGYLNDLHQYFNQGKVDSVSLFQQPDLYAPYGHHPSQPISHYTGVDVGNDFFTLPTHPPSLCNRSMSQASWYSSFNPSVRSAADLLNTGRTRQQCFPHAQHPHHPHIFTNKQRDDKIYHSDYRTPYNTPEIWGDIEDLYHQSMAAQQYLYNLMPFEDRERLQVIALSTSSVTSSVSGNELLGNWFMQEQNPLGSLTVDNRKNDGTTATGETMINQADTANTTSNIYDENTPSTPHIHRSLETAVHSVISTLSLSTNASSRGKSLSNKVSTTNESNSSVDRILELNDNLAFAVWLNKHGIYSFQKREAEQHAREQSLQTTPSLLNKGPSLLDQSPYQHILPINAMSVQSFHDMVCFIHIVTCSDAHRQLDAIHHERVIQLQQRYPWFIPASVVLPPFIGYHQQHLEDLQLDMIAKVGKKVFRREVRNLALRAQIELEYIKFHTTMMLERHELLQQQKAAYGYLHPLFHHPIRIVPTFIDRLFVNLLKPTLNYCSNVLDIDFVNNHGALQQLYNTSTTFCQENSDLQQKKSTITQSFELDRFLNGYNYSASDSEDDDLFLRPNCTAQKSVQHEQSRFEPYFQTDDDLVFSRKIVQSFLAIEAMKHHHRQHDVLVHQLFTQQSSYAHDVILSDVHDHIKRTLAEPLLRDPLASLQLYRAYTPYLHSWNEEVIAKYGSLQVDFTVLYTHIKNAFITAPLTTPPAMVDDIIMKKSWELRHFLRDEDYYHIMPKPQLYGLSHAHVVNFSGILKRIAYEKQNKAQIERHVSTTDELGLDSMIVDQPSPISSKNRQNSSISNINEQMSNKIPLLYDLIDDETTPQFTRRNQSIQADLHLRARKLKKLVSFNHNFDANNPDIPPDYKVLLPYDNLFEFSIFGDHNYKKSMEFPKDPQTEGNISPVTPQKSGDIVNDNSYIRQPCQDVTPKKKSKKATLIGEIVSQSFDNTLISSKNTKNTLDIPEMSSNCNNQPSSNPLTSSQQRFIDKERTFNPTYLPAQLLNLSISSGPCHPLIARQQTAQIHRLIRTTRIFIDITAQQSLGLQNTFPFATFSPGEYRFAPGSVQASTAKAITPNSPRKTLVSSSNQQIIEPNHSIYIEKGYCPIPVLYYLIKEGIFAHEMIPFLIKPQKKQNTFKNAVSAQNLEILARAQLNGEDVREIAQQHSIHFPSYTPHPIQYRQFEPTLYHFLNNSKYAISSDGYLFQRYTYDPGHVPTSNDYDTDSRNTNVIIVKNIEGFIYKMVVSHIYKLSKTRSTFFTDFCHKFKKSTSTPSIPAAFVLNMSLERIYSTAVAHLTPNWVQTKDIHSSLPDLADNPPHATRLLPPLTKYVRKDVFHKNKSHHRENCKKFALHVDENSKVDFDCPHFNTAPQAGKACSIDTVRTRFRSQHGDPDAHRLSPLLSPSGLEAIGPIDLALLQPATSNKSTDNALKTTRLEGLDITMPLSPSSTNQSNSISSPPLSEFYSNLSQISDRAFTHQKKEQHTDNLDLYNNNTNNNTTPTNNNDLILDTASSGILTTTESSPSPSHLAFTMQLEKSPFVPILVPTTSAPKLHSIQPIRNYPVSQHQYPLNDNSEMPLNPIGSPSASHHSMHSNTVVMISSPSPSFRIQPRGERGNKRFQPSASQTASQLQQILPNDTLQNDSVHLLESTTQSSSESVIVRENHHWTQSPPQVLAPPTQLPESQFQGSRKNPRVTFQHDSSRSNTSYTSSSSSSSSSTLPNGLVMIPHKYYCQQHAFQFPLQPHQLQIYAQYAQSTNQYDNGLDSNAVIAVINNSLQLLMDQIKYLQTNGHDQHAVEVRNDLATALNTQLNALYNTPLEPVISTFNQILISLEMTPSQVSLQSVDSPPQNNNNNGKTAPTTVDHAQQPPRTQPSQPYGPIIDYVIATHANLSSAEDHRRFNTFLFRAQTEDHELYTAITQRLYGTNVITSSEDHPDLQTLPSLPEPTVQEFDSSTNLAEEEALIRMSQTLHQDSNSSSSSGNNSFTTTTSSDVSPKNQLINLNRLPSVDNGFIGYNLPPDFMRKLSKLPPGQLALFALPDDQLTQKQLKLRHDFFFGNNHESIPFREFYPEIYNQLQNTSLHHDSNVIFKNDSWNNSFIEDKTNGGIIKQSSSTSFQHSAEQHNNLPSRNSMGMGTTRAISLDDKPPPVPPQSPPPPSPYHPYIHDNSISHDDGDEYDLGELTGAANIGISHLAVERKASLEQLQQRKRNPTMEALRSSRVMKQTSSVEPPGENNNLTLQNHKLSPQKQQFPPNHTQHVPIPNITLPLPQPTQLPPTKPPQILVSPITHSSKKILAPIIAAPAPINSPEPLTAETESAPGDFKVHPFVPKQPSFNHMISLYSQSSLRFSGGDSPSFHLLYPQAAGNSIGSNVDSFVSPNKDPARHPQKPASQQHHEHPAFINEISGGNVSNSNNTNVNMLTNIRGYLSTQIPNEQQKHINSINSTYDDTLTLQKLADISSISAKKPTSGKNIQFLNNEPQFPHKYTHETSSSSSNNTTDNNTSNNSSNLTQNSPQHNYNKSKNNVFQHTPRPIPQPFHAEIRTSQLTLQKTSTPKSPTPSNQSTTIQTLALDRLDSQLLFSANPADSYNANDTPQLNPLHQHQQQPQSQFPSKHVNDNNIPQFFNKMSSLHEE